MRKFSAGDKVFVLSNDHMLFLGLVDIKIDDALYVGHIRDSKMFYDREYFFLGKNLKTGRQAQFCHVKINSEYMFATEQEARDYFDAEAHRFPFYKKTK